MVALRSQLKNLPQEPDVKKMGTWMERGRERENPQAVVLTF